MGPFDPRLADKNVLEAFIQKITVDEAVPEDVAVFGYSLIECMRCFQCVDLGRRCELHRPVIFRVRPSK